MKYDEFISVISSDVTRILSENISNTTEKLFCDLQDSQNITKEQLLIARNSVTASVHLSVQIIFAYLDSLGILNYQNLSERFERPNLTVLKGGLSDSPDN